MRDILRQSNLDLLREIDRLLAVIYTVSIPPELLAYQDSVSEACRDLRQLVIQNLRDLDIGQDDTLDDILSQTESLTALFRLYNQRIASPLLRYRSSDLLCLRVIAWLHNHHVETKGFPAGLSDGEFGVWPEPSFPIIYFMPSSRQHSLLYLPLFFHEFGHLLYVCHRQEMDELVRDLQQEIAAALVSASQQDEHSIYRDTRMRSVIVETWYEWVQEFFCDAVGLTIGGPSFANAFSMYLRVGGRTKFYQPQKRLEFSGHPVAWLRIQLIADRARRMDLLEGNRLEQDWDRIALTLRVVKEYHGFYDDEFLPLVRRMIDDMLVEASPYRFTAEDISASDWAGSSPVHLLNRAWSTFLSDPNRYAGWEEGAVAAFLHLAGDG